ncbi:TetR/AcrR family transcriptional regulator [Streptomyces sp. NPDC005336]|uniref:TetR/AcrR family transcriptional regulator n=1 Tax=Streptomyces sp. NPDC005336 TaxID=3157035 RepID=UPI0033B125D8
MNRSGTSELESPREVILRVATSLFGERGFPATSMRDIAGEVGILAGSLYAHIDGKETLLLEIIEQGIAEYIDEATRALAGNDDSEARLRALIRAHLDVVVRGPRTTKIVFHQWRYLGEQNRAHVRRRRHEYEDIFIQVVQAGVDDGSFAADLDVRTAVRSVLGSLNWTPEWLRTDGADPIDVVAQRLADTLVLGLCRR